MTPPHGKSHGRRQFLVQTLAGGLVCWVADSGRTLLGAEQLAEKKYDLLVKGGKIVDPSQQLSAVRDVAITGHRVTSVAEEIPETQARQVLNARGKVVTPGLIDVHVHV